MVTPIPAQLCIVSSLVGSLLLTFLLHAFVSYDVLETRLIWSGSVRGVLQLVVISAQLVCLRGARDTRHGERGTGVTCMVRQMFASLFGLWTIIGDASSTLQPCRLVIPCGLAQKYNKKQQTHPISLEGKPWNNRWQNVLLNAFRNHHDRTVSIPSLGERIAQQLVIHDLKLLTSPVINDLETTRPMANCPILSPSRLLLIILASWT